MGDNNQDINIRVKATDDGSPTVKAAIDSLNASIQQLTQVQLANASATQKSKETHDDLKVGLINVTAAVHLVKEAYEIVEGAFHKVEAVIEKSIEEALAFEKANNRLAGALVSTGKYSAELVDKLDDYTDSVEKSTGANGDLVKNMIATGVQMGLSIDKAKQMEEAARKLAASTDGDLNNAFSLLQRSLTGQSKGLTLVLPQLKEFGEAQLKSGAAITAVNSILNAQYIIYQQSLPAALAKANTAVSNVYKAFGLIITQSTLAKVAVNAFTEVMVSLESGIKTVDKWLTNNKQTLIEIGGAMLKVVEIGGVLLAGYALLQAGMFAFNVVLMAQALGFTAAGYAAAAFGAVMSVVLSPIVLITAAVAALTFAFYKWPTLFDVLIGSLKTLIGIALMPLAAILAGVTVAIGATAKAMGADWGQAVEDAGKKLINLNVELVKGGIEQVKYGANAIIVGKDVVKAHNDSADAAKKNLQVQSDLNKTELERGKLYASFNIGTFVQREALRKQVSDRDTDLKQFTDYLDNKKRLAVSVQEEQQMELAKVQGKALEGAGGSAEKGAKANVAVDTEIKKQAELDALHQKGILDNEQYNQALLASDQRHAQAELEFQQAHKAEMAELLGDSPEGYQAKAEIQEAQFQLELQTKMAQAAEEMATQEQINVIKRQAETEHQAQVNEIRENQIQKDIHRNELLNNNWAVTLGKIRLEQEKHGKVIGAIKGVQASEEFHGAQQALTDLSSLRNSHSKKAFEAGKAAATAQATVNTFLAATAAFSAMAGIPLIGPALGAVAAAAAIAAGFVNIQNIQSQKFAGGQADEGMNSVPGGLAGKSFILSQGERVVQPSANRDLKEFLAKDKATGGSGGTNYNITLNYGGSGSKDDAAKMADMVINEIRSRSERGTPIMNERGLVKA